MTCRLSCNFTFLPYLIFQYMPGVPSWSSIVYTICFRKNQQYFPRVLHPLGQDENRSPIVMYKDD